MLANKTCLNLATLDNSGLNTQLTAASRAGFAAVGIRMNSLTDFISRGNTLAVVKGLLAELKLVPLEMAFFPNWVFCAENQREEMLAKLEDFAAISQAIGCKIMVLPTSFGDAPQPDLGLAVENFTEISRLAARHQLVAGMEFLPWSRIQTIKQAWQVVRQADHPAGCIILDTFHYFEGKSALSDLQTVPIEKICIVHIADVERVDTDVITLNKTYRVFPGEGIYHFQEILEYLASRNYQGYYDLEIMNPTYQKEDPFKLALRAMQSLAALLQ
jgi:4-hydroxyphenylpyruvate dioxygenase